jgi:hypothetical protein
LSPWYHRTDRVRLANPASFATMCINILPKFNIPVTVRKNHAPSSPTGRGFAMDVVAATV